MNDGAAALVLASDDYAQRNGLEALATIEGHAGAAWDPPYLALTPAMAAQKLLDRMDLAATDIAVWELNEAFAAVALHRGDAPGSRSDRDQRAGRRGRARPSDRRLGRADRRPRSSTSCAGAAAASGSRRSAAAAAKATRCSCRSVKERDAVLVVGAGQMGAGIAQVFAQHGHEVLLNDVDEVRIRRGIDGIAKRLERDVEQGPHDRRGSAAASSSTSTRARTSATSTSRSPSKPPPRISRPKLELFRRLDDNTPPEAILATNTSSISITTLARADRASPTASSACTS